MRQHSPASMPRTPALIWRGLGASAGVVSGRASVVRGGHDLAGVEDRSVLVIRHPTPAILPALVKARAAVCETGGVLNHLAVLARELGKPCVTGIAGLVEVIEPGAWLRVDGTGGAVSLLAGDARRLPPRSQAQAGARTAMAPVLRFGRFSAAFERVDGSLDLETAVRIAALVSVPDACTAGASWPFAIQAGTVLVAAGALHRTIDEVLGRLDRGAPETRALNVCYREWYAWPGWAAIAQGAPSPDRLREALRRFVSLNQITWLASAVKDPLAERYRVLLRRASASFDRPAHDHLFLDSLIMPGRSFIGRSQGTAVDEAGLRRQIAVDSLRRGLSGQDFARVMAYLDALGDLVDLTERKNTNLAGCGRGLFGSAANRRAIATLLGLGGDGDVDVRSDAAQGALVQAVLAGLRSWLPALERTDGACPERSEGPPTEGDAEWTR